jgi:prepilin-type N-terminal cleavage/methylation domain-containing protein
MNTKRAGFSLVELLIALVLIAIILLMVVPRSDTTLSGTKSALVRAELERLRTALQDAYASRGLYPPSEPAWRTDALDLFAPSAFRFRPAPGMGFRFTTTGDRQGATAYLGSPDVPITCSVPVGSIAPSTGGVPSCTSSY